MTASITRKQFLAGVGAIASAAAIRPRRASAARPTIIKLAIDQEAHTPVTDNLNAAAKAVNDATHGAVDLQIFPNSELGSDTTILSLVRTGAIPMVGMPDNILATLVPSSGIDSMGFAFKDAKTAFTALDGAVGDIVRADIEKQGLHAMHAIWDNGFREITSSTRPIKTVADLAGFKIRVPPSPVSLSLFKDLGAAAITMNVSELYTALQTKVVDGQENPLANIENQKYYEVQKYVSLTNHMWSGYWMIINGTVWKNLSADHKKAMETAFAASAAKERVDFEALDNTLKEKLTSQGMTFNDVDIASFRAKLTNSGFYKHWQEKFGSELWSALEKYTGTLA